MNYRRIAAALCTALLTVGITVNAQDNAAQWRAAVEESYEGGSSVLNYTVYNDNDTAEVAVISSCPDDNGGYTVNGVQYCGQNYQGSPDGGIRANITAYVKNGDRLRLSMEYRSEAYGEAVFGINPFIEIRHIGGASDIYELTDAGGADRWTVYVSNETAELEIKDTDSVELVIKNTRGYWHIRNLRLERYGAEDFLQSLVIDGLDGNRLTEGTVTVNGSAAQNGGTLYAALYKDSILSGINKLGRSGETFSGAFEVSGEDGLKIMAWDENMKPYMKSVSVTADGSGSYGKENEIMAIKDAYTDCFLMGNIYNTKNLYGSDRELLLKNFNAITAENLMKPQYTAPAKGSWNFADTDTMLDFAEENGLRVTGHTLVWHQQTPSWITEGTAAEVSENMKEYINTVVGHCRGRVSGWDVVNEALSDSLYKKPASWEEGLRTDSPWYTATGNKEYIYNAYIWAHNADPEAELYYNDYNLDNPYKREAAALLVKHVNDRYKAEYNTDKNLITAVGMQSHYHLLTDISAVRASIDRFREIGIHVNISELDVCLKQVLDNGLGDSSGGVTLTPALEVRQAAKYAALMSLYKENADIIDRVTFWGYSDGASWRAAQYPLMFNADLSPKKSYYAIITPENYK
ncbi:MAG: endo-1,4-beta-xylanase [Candidatus Ornithomonoglobus sp.]